MPPLTRNISGSLLQNIKRSPNLRSKDVSLAECSSPAAPEVERMRAPSVDTDAEPISSSEDETTGSPGAQPCRSSSSHDIAMAAQTSAHGKDREILAPPEEPEHKRRRINRIDPAMDTVSAAPPTSSNEFDVSFSSTASQRRGKRQPTYGRRNGKAEDQDLGISQNKFRKISHSPSPSPDKCAQASFKNPGTVPSKINPLTRSPARALNVIDDPFANDAAMKVTTRFTMDPCDPEELTSSSTIQTEARSLFEKPDLPEGCETRHRSGSLSSALSDLSDLSDPESVFAPNGNSESIDDAKVDIPYNDDTARCPLCSAPVDRAHLEEFNSGRRLNVRLQQRFCEEHKKRDASNTLDRTGYPTIDWHELEKVRIPQHMHFLKKVLQRKVPSYYRNMLERVIADSNRTGLKQFLRDGIVDVVKHGYYGPRGARLIGHEISTKMSRDLNGALKRDELVRTVEVGGYVSAVLVPELILTLLKEDLDIEDEGDALQKLAESTEIGVLINPDDETIVRKDEDD